MEAAIWCSALLSYLKVAAVVELTGHVLDLVPLPIERNVVEKRHLAFRFSRDTGSDVASGENIGDQMADTEGFEPSVRN